MNYRLASRLGLAFLAIFSIAKADTWTLSLTPSPDISGPVGQEIGWDYQITNNSQNDFLTIDSLNFDTFTNVTFDNTTNVFDYPFLIAPGGMATGNLLYFTWNPGTPTGAMNSGTFTLTAEFDDANGNFLAAAADGTARYSATATAAVTPEPADVAVILPALLLMAWFARRKMQTRDTAL